MNIKMNNMRNMVFLLILLLLVTGILLLGYSQRMKRAFEKESLAGLKRTSNMPAELIKESDLEHLPSIVRRYLHHAGVVGKEKVHNMRVCLEGRIRSNPGDGWMKLTSKQYSFFDNPTRVFYIKASKFGIPVIGLHVYKDKKASFVVKLLGLITLVDVKGDKLDQAETVTIFNDMCLLAPATLISKNIQWETIDSLSVNATFTNDNITISAQLFFNDKGELLTFISNDRYETDGETYNNYPWLTPVKEYKDCDGYRLCSKVSTDYQRPDMTFSYGEFEVKEVTYNCDEWQ